MRRLNGFILLFFAVNFLQNTSSGSNESFFEVSKKGIVYVKIMGVYYQKTDSFFYVKEQKYIIKRKIGNIKSMYSKYIRESSLKYKIPEELILSVIYVESGGNAKAVGNAGEIGLMQTKPTTVNIKRELLFSPRINIDAGSRFLQRLINESWENNRTVRLDKAIIRYNAGFFSFNKGNDLIGDINNVLRILKDGEKQTTYEYIIKVLGKNGLMEIQNNN
jgi:membrane-bound lytic murein transglycosylase MltF